MRRLISIAAFALMLAVPVWAQRGGGHSGGHAGGGGLHGGGFSGHGGGGHIGGGRSFSGMHSGGTHPGSGFSRGFNHSFNRGFTHGAFRDRGFRDRDRGFRGRRHRDFDDFSFRNNCFGVGCWGGGFAYPWWGWYYDPWLSWQEEDRRFDDDYDRQYDIANRMNEQSLEQQRLIRQEEADGDQDAYRPPSSARRSAPANDPPGDPVIPATVLVFRDQHREEISNYAIVGQTLWSFTGQRTKKIPLVDLDLSATEKTNDDRGVTFRVPGAIEGQ